VADKAPPVAKQAPLVAEEEQVPPTYNQVIEEGEMNSEDMEKCTEMGGNVAAAKYVNDEISQINNSKIIHMRRKVS
jgi:hypothetical protein